jgi:hypothetical protein
VFRAEVVVTPVQAPNANAHAERWIRTVRAGCLDWLLIIGRGPLEQVLGRYVEHYNRHRPHRPLGLEPPGPSAGLTLSARLGEPGCTDATSLVACFTSTGEQHERFAHLRAPVSSEWRGNECAGPFVSCAAAPFSVDCRLGQVGRVTVNPSWLAAAAIRSS